MPPQNLAIMGAPPAFTEKLHVGRPNQGDRADIMRRIEEILDRDWLTNNGPCVQEFERRLEEFLGVRNVITMCNATIALEIAARALGFKGEVILPSFTFVATAHALQWQEITPVFCDIKPSAYAIDPEQIERHITPRTTGIIGVHVFGEPCDIEALDEIAKKHKLRLLFDSAHAFGCAHKGRPIGCFGDAEVFSFHATKFFNTFEGGAVATNDDDLAKKIRLMKNFGFSGQDNVIYIGTNGKMNEVSAAMGLSSFDRLDSFIKANRVNYESYQSGLQDLPGAKLLEYDSSEKRNYQYIVLNISDTQNGLSRDELQKVLVSENILARRYFYPGCHMMEPYRSYFPHAKLLLPNTERQTKCTLCLPTGTAVRPDQAEMISDIIRAALENPREIKEALKTQKEDI